MYAYNGDRSEEDLVRFATAASRDTASARTLPAGTAPYEPVACSLLCSFGVVSVVMSWCRFNMCSVLQCCG